MNGFIEKDTLQTKAAQLGVVLDETALERFDIYAKALVEWNEKINLTAITAPKDIVAKHFVDSLAVLTAVAPQAGAKLIDVGTGAGFPGLALLIARPDLQVTLLDSTKKKLMVLDDILQRLSLSAELLHARAEETGQNPQYREQFDLVTARAVAPLHLLAEYCLPFAKVGGQFVAMKSSTVREELAEGAFAVRTLGGEKPQCTTLTLEDVGARSLVLIKKRTTTNPKYPRPSAKIAKNPLISGKKSAKTEK